jgi:hypothetical protein
LCIMYYNIDIEQIMLKEDVLCHRI